MAIGDDTATLAMLPVQGPRGEGCRAQSFACRKSTSCALSDRRAGASLFNIMAARVIAGVLSSSCGYRDDACVSADSHSTEDTLMLSQQPWARETLGSTALYSLQLETAKRLWYCAYIPHQTDTCQSNIVLLSKRCRRCYDEGLTSGYRSGQCGLNLCAPRRLDI